VLFLVGDAGGKEFDGNPAMRHMKAAVTALDERGVPATVLFLGDNVYDEGVRESHPEDLRRLGAQVEVVAGTSARGTFVPGNHDRANTGAAKGLERLMNQQLALRDFSDNGADVGLLPGDGCPGPVQENLEDYRGNVVAVLVMLDTSWWMLDPTTPTTCSPSTRDGMIREIERILSVASDIPAIVAAHHPLVTGGPHGGNAGSLRWVANRLGLIREDLNTPHYLTFIDRMTEVFGRAARPILYVAGHDHSLQVIDEPREGASVLHLVSGSGSSVSPAKPVAGSRFAAGLPGYMRLDFRSSGLIQLSVVAECTMDAVEARFCQGPGAGGFRSVYRARVR
jgi:hypothetical protein